MGLNCLFSSVWRSNVLVMLDSAVQRGTLCPDSSTVAPAPIGMTWITWAPLKTQLWHWGTLNMHFRQLNDTVGPIERVFVDLGSSARAKRAKRAKNALNLDKKQPCLIPSFCSDYFVFWPNPTIPKLISANERFLGVYRMRFRGFGLLSSSEASEASEKRAEPW